ncbi:MAG: hypothetical protein IVW53_03285 [Chloroflexi bacterium]|nr:hypothetical protein [Chloroflexota bacterium]
MTMHRRPLGRGRRIAAAFAIVTLVGCLVPWSTVGGADGLPPYSDNAFVGTGLLVFLAALAMLALVSLPFTSERPIGLDRWPAYLIVVVVAFVGFIVRLAALIAEGPLDALRPDHAPGLVIVAIGIVGLGRAVLEIHHEPEPR